MSHKIYGPLGDRSLPWRILACLLILLGALATSRAANAPENGFAKGNRLYGAGQFADAASSYEEVVRHGEMSANLFYNLGNAYYHAGNKGRAILSYQRALVLEPGHAEASANLLFVRGRVAEGGIHGSGAWSSLRDALAGPGVDFYCWLAAGAGWFGTAGLLLAIFRRRWRVAGAVLATAGALGCLLFAGIAFGIGDGLKSARRAVIIADAGAPALYSPADNAKTIVRLPVGGEVRVLSSQGAWIYVQLGDGARGWMAADQIARINPLAR